MTITRPGAPTTGRSAHRLEHPIKTMEPLLNRQMGATVASIGTSLQPARPGSHSNGWLGRRRLAADVGGPAQSGIEDLDHHRRAQGDPGGVTVPPGQLDWLVEDP